MIFRTLCLSVVAAAMGTLLAAPNSDQIVAISVTATKSDWKEASKFSYIERDVESKRHGMQKTYRVLMIDGSPYNLVTAFNDQDLSPAEKEAEQQKLQKEIRKRRNESDRERRRRIAKFEKENEHNHQMLQEMVEAFEFHLAGEAQVDGHPCWVLDAEPKPGFEATDHEGRVLKGMKGRLWIDKSSNQWVKVHAEVVKPVSFYGFLAKVGPGTEFDLEQEPVSDGVWLPKVFTVHVRASALGLFSENSDETDTYRDYQAMPQALALLQSSK
jgi:Skp family chaperone for outer membrane proteins